MRLLLWFCCLAILFSSGNLIACLWDSETLQQERERFPDTNELITGKFPRHSPEFYQWRLDDRQKKLANVPDNDQLLDDIAVSHEKLGQHAKAIEVAQQQLQRNPDRYETLANLGTFLIHDGQWAAGLKFIDKAIEVNPDAHFGREKYQRLLVKYLMKLYPDGEITYPITSPDAEDFPAFIVSQSLSASEQDLASLQPISATQRQAAVKGILGMMRFAQHDHPVLLEVLGQLLASGHEPKEDAKQLASRCFLALAWKGGDPATRKEYLKLAQRALSGQASSSGGSAQLPVASIQSQFRQELNEADAWYRKLTVKEKKWIREGKDVEAEYAKEYLNEPTKLSATVSSANPDESVASIVRGKSTVTLLIAGLLASGVLAATVLGLTKRNSSNAR